MFRRRKKEQPQIEVLDGDEESHRTPSVDVKESTVMTSASSETVPTSSSQNKKTRADLGLDPFDTAQPQPTAEELQNMTEQQLQTLIQQSANSGKESTGRALRIANEAREIGVNTAEKMQQQTTQLDKMTDDIEVVHDYLDKSEATIEKMTKNRFVRMFNMKKPKGKGLDQHKASRKEQEAREELRAKGLDAIDVREMQNKDGVVTMNEIEREQLFDGKGSENPGESGKKLRLFGKKAQPEEVRVDTKDIKENYSQYSDGVATVLKKQDEDLDQLSDVLGDMKVLATAMNNELSYQGQKIEEVQDFTDETSRRTKQNVRKIAKIK